MSVTCPALLLFVQFISHRRIRGRSREIEKDVECARLFKNSRVHLFYEEDAIWIF